MNIYVSFNFGISQMFLEIQSFNPFGKFYLWALMIAVNVSVAICQSAIRQFPQFGNNFGGIARESV